MRSVLLSAVKRNENGELRASATLAGRSILAWQVDFARDLGCERVICLSEGADGDLLKLQRQVEASGLEFHLIRSNAQLVALLRTDDQLLMLMDGLVTEGVDPAMIEAKHDRLLPQVLTLPADAKLAQAFPEDFERLDAQRRWVGVAVVGSATVQKLADCPPDGEVMSLLLRLALQDGARCKPLSQQQSDPATDLLVSSQEELDKRQSQLVKDSLGELFWSGPSLVSGKLMAGRLVQRNAAVSPAMMFVAMAALALFAVVLTVLGQTGAALIAVAVSAFLGHSGISYAKLRRDLNLDSRLPGYVSGVPIFIDSLAVGALIVSLSPLDGQIERLALPVFAIGLARLGTNTAQDNHAAFWSDRASQLLIFALAHFGGVFVEALAVFGIGALSYNLLRNRANSANRGLTITR